MAQIPYIFNQLVSHIPKDVFDRLVKKYRGNFHIKKFSCWNHLLLMIWAQLTSRKSLRDIETSLRAHADKVYRMGIGSEISRNAIANANAKRDVAIYRELAQGMMLLACKINVKDELLQMISKQFQLNGFFAIDSTTVSLDLRKFTWSVPQEEWGGVKLHTMYDLLRMVPRMCLITGHEERDQTFMEDYPYEANCFYMFDKMYLKTRGLNCVELANAYFVTRLKKNMVYETLESSVAVSNRILEDSTIRFTSRWAREGYPKPLRKICYYSSEKNEVIVFLTNNFLLEAATIALLYQYRWQIELFFKWIKQHLKIESFYGTSANAVMIQIYTAVVSYCLLAICADSVKFNGSLYEFANLISVSLTEKIYLVDLIKRYYKQPSVNEKYYELPIFDFSNLQ